jgi:hypothetical protein
MVMLLALSACTSAPKSPPAPPAVPVAAAAALDASYDWHGLLLVPFGSSLKDVPFTLHEVLLFRDAAHAAQSDDAECYAMERAAPRFVARIPSGYLLCFRNDRLARVEATVYLPLNEAAGIFGDACELWLRNTAAAPAATPPACEGRDGAIGYSGRLEENADQTQVPLTIRLDAIAEP